MSENRAEVKKLLDSIRSEAGSQQSLIDIWDRRRITLKPELRFQAFSYMMKGDFWFWLPLICHMLDREIGGPYFMTMIQSLAGHVNEKLAGEIFWSGLVDGGKRMPEDAIASARGLLAEKREANAIFASSLLAGAARTRPDEVIDILLSLFGSPEPTRRSAAYRTANITMREGTLPGEKIADIVLSYPIPSESGLRSTYSMTLRLIHPFNQEAVESRFREMLRSSPDYLRMQVIYDISVLKDISEETKILLDEYTKS